MNQCVHSGFFFAETLGASWCRDGHHLMMAVTIKQSFSWRTQHGKKKLQLERHASRQQTDKLGNTTSQNIQERRLQFPLLRHLGGQQAEQATNATT